MRLALAALAVLLVLAGTAQATLVPEPLERCPDAGPFVRNLCFFLEVFCRTHLGQPCLS